MVSMMFLRPVLLIEGLACTAMPPGTWFHLHDRRYSVVGEAQLLVQGMGIVVEA